jgi:uncharacterized metal-binding protein YceD (DUF177 family)
MANPLFARILPKEAATLGQLIEYKGEVGDFERLSEIVAADIAALSEDMQPRNWRAASVAIRLEFAWADGLEGIPAINGRASAKLPAVCQRCLEAFDLSLDTAVNMLLVTPAESVDVDKHEVWELEDEAFRVLDIVEEALVMAMPLAPTHDSGESCAAMTIENTDSGSETGRPFADLKSQLEKMNN